MIFLDVCHLHHSQGAGGGEYGNEVGARLGVTTAYSSISRCEEDGGTASTEGSVCLTHVAATEVRISTMLTQRIYTTSIHRQILSDVVLVEPIARRQDSRDSRLVDEEIDLVEEAANAVAVVEAYRDEFDRDSSGYADRILYI